MLCIGTNKGRRVNQAMKKAPAFLKQYFWDIDFDKLDIEKYPLYVVARILNYGDEKAIAWM